MSDISLSKAVRSNLLSLQSTAATMAKTQERLATGLKVNSALDNPTNFFTASALNSRASDMANLLDSMSSGIKTIEAADNGLKSITKTVESMQSALRQARQDKSFKTESYTIDMARTAASGDKITFTDGAFAAATSVNINNSSITTAAAVADVVVGDNGKNFTVTDGTTTSGTVALATGDTVQDIADKINTAAGTDSTFKASVSEGKLVITSTTGNSVSVTDGGTAGASTLLGFGAVAYSAKSVDEIVLAVNKDTAVSDKVRASNDNGKLRIQNLSTTALSVSGTVSGATSIGGNDVRANLVKQFNELRDQLDKFADDASFNGINLLRGDKLKLTFNETGTSTIEIQAKDKTGNPTSVDNTALGIEEVFLSDFDSDVKVDAKLDVLADVMGKLRSHASSFGSNLSIVENRTDFTKNMINTLQTGAANLTLADTNEEAANLLALQTRQQLSSTALSMASQADQAVLRLFG